MNVSFIPVKSARDQERLAQLAGIIWREYWPALIGKAQTEYMIEQFQSLEAIQRDMAQHAYEYWFIVATDGETGAGGKDGAAGKNGAGGEDGAAGKNGADGEDGAAGKNGTAGADASESEKNAAPRKRIVGFTGGHDEPETNRFFISKIYLLAHERGHGFARRTIEFYEDLCFARGAGACYLTVNKGNELGIRAYKGTGFDIIDAVQTDIGSGFVMDDYIMEKVIDN